jgi:signal transduction histidine kinase
MLREYPSDHVRSRTSGTTPDSRDPIGGIRGVVAVVRETRTLQLPLDLPAVRTARRAVNEWLDDAPEALRSSAALVATEMVSNAIRYGRPPIRLELAREESRVRLVVRDDGGGEPKQRTPGASGGWGLHIVERLATRWGAAAGTTEVWAEIEA